MLKHDFDINHSYEPDWIRLDQSENPYGFLYNRYPSKSNEINLYQAYINYLNTDLDLDCQLSTNNFLFTRGAADAIDLILRTFSIHSNEEIIVSDPTFFPITHWAKLYKIKVKTEKLIGHSFDHLNVTNIINSKAKICFLINPNNPTSTALNPDTLNNILDKFEGLIVVDEAYIDFCHDKTVVTAVNKMKNLIVLRTMSKAWGCAGQRAGFIITAPHLIQQIQQVQAPFMCDSFTCDHVSFLLSSRYYEFKQLRELILNNRNNVLAFLSENNTITLPSSTNFILMKDLSYEYLERRLFEQQKIIYKNVMIQGSRYLRIGIGNRLEMDAFKKIFLNKVYSHEQCS